VVFNVTFWRTTLERCAYGENNIYEGRAGITEIDCGNIPKDSNSIIQWVGSRREFQLIAQVESKELGKTDGLLERFVPRCPSKRTQCGVRFWTREIPSPPLCIHQLCFQPLFYLIKFLVDDLAKRPHCKSVEREERALYLQGSSILYADGSRARPKLGPTFDLASLVMRHT
jgi:hypothetical protein